MNDIKVKICGLTRIEDIDCVNEINPDYIGFVFAESKRKVTRETAYLLKQRLNPASKSTLAVGVFVNADIDDIIGIYSDGIIDIAQLHGDETAEYIERLKSKREIPVIKAVNIAHVLPDNADYLLFDNGKGGTGETFDWGGIPPSEKKFFLAGGLNLQNVVNAINAVNPFAVDVSSGVETNGVKDPVKMREFVRLVRSF